MGTVSETFNPLFYRLLHAFKRLTGIGMVLNTSFNDKGEPLVQTCEQALRLFASSRMDVLILGNWIFDDKRNAQQSAFDPLSVNCRKLEAKATLLVAHPESSHVARFTHVMLRENSALRTGRLSTGGSSGSLHFSLSMAALQDMCDILNASDRWHQAVLLVPWQADRYVFDPSVYYSEAAELSRRVIESGNCELFWADPSGQVVPARDVLYVHHRNQPTGVPPAYGRYWNKEYAVS